jgi:hypothetical protein
VKVSPSQPSASALSAARAAVPGSETVMQQS